MSVQLPTSTPKVMLETVSPGSLVMFADQSHPRYGQVGVVGTPLDRGKMTNQAGFAPGIHITLVAVPVVEITSYAQAIVQVVAQ